MSNKLKIIIGLALVACAFICAMVVLYFINDQTAENLKQNSALQAQLANLIAEKSEPVLSPADRRRVKREPVDLVDLLARTEKIYGPQELKRKDGILWVDRASGTCMITLGAANGLVAGAYLGVYQDISSPNGSVVSEKITDVVVDQAYDIVSYVKLTNKSLKDLGQDYYRVTVRDAQ